MLLHANATNLNAIEAVSHNYIIFTIFYMCTAFVFNLLSVWSAHFDYTLFV